MATPIAIPIPTPTPTPKAALTPFQEYQLALQKYAPQFATATPMPSANYGTPAPVKAPQAAGANPGTAIIPSLLVAKAIAGGSAAAPAASGLASTAAANAAWNAPALAAAGETTAAAPVAAGGLGALPIAGIGIAGLLAGKAGYDMFKGKKPSLPGRIILGMGTGGLSEVANHFLNHKSTKEYQRERWGNLGESTHAPTAQYANNYLNYLGSDQAKIDAQYPNTFGAKKEAGTLKAEDVWGGLGMFKTFGDDWLGKYSEDQRRNISNELIKQNLLGNSKGDITILDPEKAKQVASTSIASMLAKPLGAAPIRKDSPGFKDGKRINYGAKK